MDKGFAILERLMQATEKRHRVLTSNIANTDTPNYKAKDVNFKDYITGEAAGITITATDPKHLQPAGPAGKAEVLTETSQQWGDGNNVELDMEIAKMTENGLLHQAGVRLLSAKMRLFRTAIKAR